jgi:hypothetical protein
MPVNFLEAIRSVRLKWDQQIDEKKMWCFWLVIAENVVLECAFNISDSSLEDNLTEELLCSCCSFSPSSPPSPHVTTTVKSFHSFTNLVA